MAIDEATPVRPGHLPMRRQRIDRWIQKGRSVSNNRRVVCASTSSTEKRSESALFQADRQLRMSLLRLGEEREKLIERFNFDQKLFANKQVLRHKDNPTVVNTLNYVRKCCKFSELYGHEEELIDPSLFFDERSTNQMRRSQSSKSSRDVSSKKPPSIDISDKDSKQQVQFQMSTKRGSQSAHVNSRSRPPDRNVVTSLTVPSHRSRSINSAPPVSIIGHRVNTVKTSAKSQRPSSRIFCTKKSLEEFRCYPERLLSASNRYLPLLRQQAMESRAREFQRKQSRQMSVSISRLSNGSDLADDDEVKSFLSEDIDTGKTAHIPVWDNYERRKSIKPPLSSKLDLTEKVHDDTSEYAAVVSRLRDREYSRLQTLIHSNTIQHILEPLSIEKKRDKPITLSELLRSNDSLRCSTTFVNPQQKAMNIERNLSKIGVMIY